MLLWLSQKNGSCLQFGYRGSVHISHNVLIPRLFRNVWGETLHKFFHIFNYFRLTAALLVSLHVVDVAYDLSVTTVMWLNSSYSYQNIGLSFDETSLLHSYYHYYMTIILITITLPVLYTCIPSFSDNCIVYTILDLSIILCFYARIWHLESSFQPNNLEKNKCHHCIGKSATKSTREYTLGWDDLILFVIKSMQWGGSIWHFL